MSAAPFAHTSGPKDAKIVLVGEAWGEQEDLVKLPFVGSSGQELTRMLLEAGLKRADLLLTNVMAFRPPSNNMDFLCDNKKSVGGSSYPYSHLKQGKYVRPEFFPELDRLKAELLAYPRNLVMALGNTACWALLNSARIGALRGAIASTVTLQTPLKILPTYHPTAVMRQWSYRPIVIADFIKAKRESAWPEIRRPRRSILVNPTLQDIRQWYLEYAVQANILSVDIETSNGQIKMIGFSDTPERAIVIPFLERRNRGWSYWDSAQDEKLAWELTDRFLTLPCVKLFQNGLFDLQYIYKMGIRPVNCHADTMLMHHSIYPEMQKGLGFLGSIYTNEASWKLMRGRRATETEELKRDE